MIVDLIVGALFGLLNSVVSMIPEFSPWGEAGVQGDKAYPFVGTGETVKQWLFAFNQFLPIRAFIVCIGAIASARLFVVLVQFFKWVWESLPFKST